MGLLRWCDCVSSVGAGMKSSRQFYAVDTGFFICACMGTVAFQTHCQMSCQTCVMLGMSMSAFSDCWTPTTQMVLVSRQLDSSSRTAWAPCQFTQVGSDQST